MAKIIDDETIENVCILAKLSLSDEAKEKAKEKNGKSAEKEAENSAAEQETPADDTVKSEDGELVFSTTTELDD